MPSADDDAAHVLRIGGMTCGHCVGAVTSALEGVAGVARADVDLERGLATVAAAPGASLALADLVDAVEASGFDASDAAGGGGGDSMGFGVGGAPGGGDRAPDDIVRSGSRG
mmetsp:Transcript_21693/g.71762  ORF Transcript_21693/g.71762 Transcript_21693/m.71762 type:complete len:112 (+) Transcript_21693:33-368(+)